MNSSMRKLRTNSAFRWLLPVAWAGVIFFLSDQPSLHSPLPYGWDLILRKAAHLAEYAVLTFLLLHALDPRTRSTRAVLTALVLAVLYAGTDEAHQAFVLGRHPSGFDVALDALGAVLGATAVPSRVGRWWGGRTGSGGSAGSTAGPT